MAETSEMKKISFLPSEQSTNLYLNLMKKTYFQAGFHETGLKEAEFVSLNWFESFYFSSFFKVTREFLVKILRLAFMVLTRKKIIWTYHNRVPHEGKYIGYSKFILKLLSIFSTYIVIHAKESKKVLLEDFPKIKPEKIIYFPHPNYIDSYPPNLCPQKYKATEEDIVITFFGAVKPYKNIEKLISAMNQLNNPWVKLKIYGKPSSKEYQSYLEKLVRTSNIELNFGFIADDKVSKVMEECDVLITPYSKESMLNSGTHILAFSYGKTVISTLICSLRDIPKELWIEIKNDDEIEIIKILEMLHEKISAQELAEMGKKLKMNVMSHNSIEKISEVIKSNLL